MIPLSERIARDVLRAAGSNLDHYTMPGNRQRIVEAAGVADDLLAALRWIIQNPFADSANMVALALGVLRPIADQDRAEGGAE